jgi:two-component system KDP operon response regulator KdpE
MLGAVPSGAIIDLVLPDGDGVEVSRRLREWSAMPIIVLSALGEEDQKVRALEAGADDYVTKPFGPRELVARLQADLRRAAPGAEGAVPRAGEHELDIAAHVARLSGDEVHLNRTEFNLLKLLMTNRGRRSRMPRSCDLWGPAYEDDIPTLGTHVANLRHALGASFAPLTT